MFIILIIIIIIFIKYDIILLSCIHYPDYNYNHSCYVSYLLFINPSRSSPQNTGLASSWLWRWWRWRWRWRYLLMIRYNENKFSDNQCQLLFQPRVEIFVCRSPGPSNYRSFFYYFLFYKNNICISPIIGHFLIFLYNKKYLYLS